MKGVPGGAQRCHTVDVGRVGPESRVVQAWYDWLFPLSPCLLQPFSTHRPAPVASPASGRLSQMSGPIQMAAGPHPLPHRRQQQRPSKYQSAGGEGGDGREEDREKKVKFLVDVLQVLCRDRLHKPRSCSLAGRWLFKPFCGGATINCCFLCNSEARFSRFSGKTLIKTLGCRQQRNVRGERGESSHRTIWF